MTTTLNFATLRKANVAEWLNSYVTLPVFSYAGLIWAGASVVITQFNFTATKNFTIKNLPTPPVNVNFCLVIRYRIAGQTYRYKLWQNVGETLNENIYNGQIIKKNFVLEVWSTQNSTEVSLTTAINIGLSIRKVPTTYISLADYEDNALVEEVNSQAIVAPTPSLPVYDVLSAQYKADALSLAVDAPVVSWVDSTGNGKTLVGNGNSTYKSLGFGTNDKPYVKFSNNGLMAFVGPAPVVNMIYIAIRLNSFAASKTIYDDGARVLKYDAATDSLNLVYDGCTSNISVAGLYGIPIIISMFRLNTPMTQNCIEIVKMSDIVTQIAYTQTNSGNFANPLATQVQLGDAVISGSNPFDIAEVLLLSTNFAGVPDQGARDNEVKGYLASKYGGAFFMPMTFNDGVPWLDN